LLQLGKDFIQIPLSYKWGRITTLTTNDLNDTKDTNDANDILTTKDLNDANNKCRWCRWCPAMRAFYGLRHGRTPPTTVTIFKFDESKGITKASVSLIFSPNPIIA